MEKENDMKKRRTAERWLADIFRTKELLRKADEKDKRLDKSVGSQINNSQDKTPDTDWRRLMRGE